MATCNDCGQTYEARGLALHIKKCEIKKRNLKNALTRFVPKKLFKRRRTCDPDSGPDISNCNPTNKTAAGTLLGNASELDRNTISEHLGPQNDNGYHVQTPPATQVSSSLAT